MFPNHPSFALQPEYTGKDVRVTGSAQPAELSGASRLQGGMGSARDRKRPRRVINRLTRSRGPLSRQRKSSRGELRIHSLPKAPSRKLEFPRLAARNDNRTAAAARARISGAEHSEIRSSPSTCRRDSRIDGRKSRTGDTD